MFSGAFLLNFICLIINKGNISMWEKRKNVLPVQWKLMSIPANAQFVAMNFQNLTNGMLWVPFYW